MDINQVSEHKKRNSCYKKNDSYDIFISDEGNKYFFFQRLLFNAKSLFRFLIIFLYNLGPIYILFVYFHFRTYSRLKTNNHHKLNPERLLLIVLLDVLISLSLFSIYPSFGYFLLISIYKNWFLNIIAFQAIITFFRSYQQCMLLKKQQKEAASEKDDNDQTPPQFAFDFSYEDLVSEEGFISMRLGYFTTAYLQQLFQSKELRRIKQTESFIDQIKDIVLSEQTDLTLSYFTLIQDQKILQKAKWYKYTPREPIKEEQKKKLRNFTSLTTLMTEQNQFLSVEDILKQLGFQGRRKIIQNYLFPQYMHTKQEKQKSIVLKFALLVVVLVAKIIGPTIFLIQEFNATVLLCTLILIGFYSHIYFLVYELSDNGDIHTKFHINEELSRLIEIEDYLDDEEETSTLDITCTLSWQSWNIMRHIALQLEREIQDNINFKYWVIVFYGKLCYLAYFKCEFDSDFILNSDYCGQPILLFNIHIDIVRFVFFNVQLLIALISCVRIYYGSLLNDSIYLVREKIYKLKTIFEDLDTLFDFYFSSGVEEQIKNRCYFAVVKLIKRYVEYKMSRKFEEEWEEDEDALFDDEQLECAKTRIGEIKAALESISVMVERDEKKYINRFMGIMEANQDKITQILVLLVILFLPNLYTKIDDELGALS